MQSEITIGETEADLIKIMTDIQIRQILLFIIYYIQISNTISSLIMTAYKQILHIFFYDVLIETNRWGSQILFDYVVELAERGRDLPILEYSLFID